MSLSKFNPKYRVFMRRVAAVFVGASLMLATPVAIAAETAADEGPTASLTSATLSRSSVSGEFTAGETVTLGFSYRVTLPESVGGDRGVPNLSINLPEWLKLPTNAEVVNLNVNVDRNGEITRGVEIGSCEAIKTNSLTCSFKKDLVENYSGIRITGDAVVSTYVAAAGTQWSVPVKLGDVTVDTSTLLEGDQSKGTVGDPGPQSDDWIATKLKTPVKRGWVWEVANIGGKGWVPVLWQIDFNGNGKKVILVDTLPDYSKVAYLPDQPKPFDSAYFAVKRKKFSSEEGWETVDPDNVHSGKESQNNIDKKLIVTVENTDPNYLYRLEFLTIYPNQNKPDEIITYSNSETIENTVSIGEQHAKFGVTAANFASSTGNGNFQASVKIKKTVKGDPACLVKYAQLIKRAPKDSADTFSFSLTHDDDAKSTQNLPIKVEKMDGTYKGSGDFAERLEPKQTVTVSEDTTKLPNIQGCEWSTTYSKGDATTDKNFDHFRIADNGAGPVTITAGSGEVYEVAVTNDLRSSTPAIPVVPTKPQEPTTPTSPEKPASPAQPTKPTEPVTPNLPVTSANQPAKRHANPPLAETGTQTAALFRVTALLFTCGAGLVVARRARPRQ